MHKWHIGKVSVTQVVELTTSSIGAHILPDATPENLKKIPWITPFVDESYKPILSMHCLVIETENKTIVVDTCIGNDKTRNYPKWDHMQSDFLTRFADAGFDVARVDTVLCTHLHVDHVGWNTRWDDGKWVPTFPNATYLFAEQEFNFWQTEPQEYGPVFEDSVQPIFELGRAQLVQTNHQVSDEVCLKPTPGHTPGHVSVHISSQGEDAIITGDITHHPCQIAHQDWICTADNDATAARVTREEFVRQYADSQTLIIGTHFSGPTAGHIVRDGNSFRFDS